MKHLILFLCVFAVVAELSAQTFTVDSSGNPTIIPNKGTVIVTKAQTVSKALAVSDSIPKIDVAWNLDSLVAPGTNSTHDWQTLSEVRAHTDSTELANLPDYRKDERTIVRLCKLCGRIEMRTERISQTMILNPSASSIRAALKK